MHDLKLLLWQGGITLTIILVWSIVSAIPIVNSKLPELWFPLIGVAGILSVWAIAGAVAGLWADNWWLYLFGSLGLGMIMVLGTFAFMTLFHRTMMNSPGQGPMILMMPILIGALAYPVFGLIRLALAAFKKL